MPGWFLPEADHQREGVRAVVVGPHRKVSELCGQQFASGDNALPPSAMPALRSFFAMRRFSAPTGSRDRGREPWLLEK